MSFAEKKVCHRGIQHTSLRMASKDESQSYGESQSYETELILNKY